MVERIPECRFCDGPGGARSQSHSLLVALLENSASTLLENGLLERRLFNGFVTS
jgi:hypothetical protein